MMEINAGLGSLEKGTPGIRQKICKRRLEHCVAQESKEVLKQTDRHAHARAHTNPSVAGLPKVT